MTEAVGLSIPAVGTYVSCKDIQQVEHAMKGVKALGAPALRVNVPTFDGKVSYLRLRDQAIGQYRDVEALAKQYGLKALVEMHMGNIVPSASACAAFMHNFNPPAMSAQSTMLATWSMKAMSTIAWAWKSSVLTSPTCH